MLQGISILNYISILFLKQKNIERLDPWQDIIATWHLK
jgi:hypothetical protein